MSSSVARAALSALREGREPDPTVARRLITRTFAGCSVAIPADLVWALPVALLGRLVFVVVTGRVWEDALIPLSHVQNALAGGGLTAHPGEGVVYGFTSALSVLIPLLGELIASGGGLVALRVASLLAVVWALVNADRLCASLGVSPWPKRLLLAYLALDPLQVFYGMAGMETQVAVALLLWSIWRSTEDRPVLYGLALRLAVLVRPDAGIVSPVAWGGLAKRTIDVHLDVLGRGACPSAFVDRRAEP